MALPVPARSLASNITVHFSVTVAGLLLSRRRSASAESFFSSPLLPSPFPLATDCCRIDIRSLMSLTSSLPRVVVSRCNHGVTFTAGRCHSVSKREYPVVLSGASTGDAWNAGCFGISTGEVWCKAKQVAMHSKEAHERRTDYHSERPSGKNLFHSKQQRLYRE